MEARGRVDSGAQQHRLARPAGVEHGDGARLGWTRLHLEAKLAEPVRDLQARLLLAEAHLGMAVEVAAGVHHLLPPGFWGSGELPLPRPQPRTQTYARAPASPTPIPPPGC